MAEVEQTRGVRKTREGVVVSDKASKTITVSVERRTRHKLYGKEVTQRSTVHAHDENEEAKLGDRVRVIECRPMSKLKRWRLQSVLSKDGQ